MVAINNRPSNTYDITENFGCLYWTSKEVITRRSQYELRKAENRQHIVEGLKKALSILDQVIETIRASKDKRNAKR